jgi:hypothetical protein
MSGPRPLERISRPGNPCRCECCRVRSLGSRAVKEKDLKVRIVEPSPEAKKAADEAVKEWFRAYLNKERPEYRWEIVEKNE